ncbi:iron-containing alcohol dehydrogenase family protein [Bacillus alkalisoli]|uniref:iron-containing alcohol dehydrogenase family protein n=1 Tax=Bacillus alkalisoli TaxID=2011008 RepID=UPI000C2446AA|nr:iron-containing alcohol dehydrogenase family protein [Bacillus alkalisoli]
MTHSPSSISIPTILEIRPGIIKNLEPIWKKFDFKDIVFLVDDYTYETFSSLISTSMKETEIDIINFSGHYDINDLISIAFKLRNFDVVVAMGGGAVVDYGKYIAWSRKLPFISIPTSASNDGFASSNCSLMVNGKKTTVPAKVPFGIIVDLSIIEQAPEKFILSGIGDLMSNMTALVDWEFEEKNGVGSVNAFAAMLSKKALNSFVRTPLTDIRHPIFLKELVSSMTMGGIATDISGNSNPISGSEHLISHALDKISPQPNMHGIQVGVATYIMANIQGHRQERVRKVLERTVFFEYAKTLNLVKEEFIEAIHLAPDIKPTRYTYLHEKKYRDNAIHFIQDDFLLQGILK